MAQEIQQSPIHYLKTQTATFLEVEGHRRAARRCPKQPNYPFLARMLRALNSPSHVRACTTLSPFLNRSLKLRHSIEESTGNSRANRPHGDLSSSPPNFAGIAETVISKCSYLNDYNRGKSSTNIVLKDFLVGLSRIHPDTVRRFWRISALRPQDVLDILLAFESHDVGARTVEYVWGVFNWASGQYDEFKHFSSSCKIMASMVARVGLLSEAESLLSRREMEGTLLDCKEFFDNLIEGYLGEFDLDSAFSVYVRMRRLSLVPSILSFHALIKYLIKLSETDLMYNIYADMLMMGMVGSLEEKGIHEDVIRLLCMDGKVQESRNLVKKLLNYGIKPSDLIIHAIVHGYCTKKDYDDMLSFLAEVRIEPDVVVGNKILFSLCRNFSIDQAGAFLQKLEELGFCPSEVSLGILIGFCCHEGKLKSAFHYVSDILSRGLKPHVYSYNAILSAMFKGGKWMLSQDILAEMKDMGVMPELSTFRVLLAGFCHARKFDEVKAIVREMAVQNLVTLSSLEDPLNKGFVFLGLNPLGVRIKRDNDKGFSKTEFYDELGNGLYLDTDLDKFEKRIAQVLDNAMVPDFNSSIIEKCQNSDIKSTLMTVDEIARWGQEMSLPALTSLFHCLSRAPSSIENINHHLGVMLKSIYDLDQKTLNTVIRTYSRKGFTFEGRTLFDGMLRRGYNIENSTYSSLLVSSCKKGDLKSFHYFCKLAQKSKWSPEVKDGNALLTYLCRNKWMNEALELFETMLFMTSSSDVSDTSQSLLGKLCRHGFTSTASVLLSELLNRTTFSDHTAYSHLISGFCLENRLPEALKLFEKMLSMNLSPLLDVYTQLISQLCRSRNFKKAIELKNICLRDQPSAELPIHSALIIGFSKSGRAEEAGSLFKASLLKGLFPNADVFNSLIKGYCVVNNSNKVRELLGYMMRKNLSIFVSSYSNIARLLCTEGRFTLAISLKEIILQVNELPELVLHNILIFHLSSLHNSSILDAISEDLQMKEIPFDDVTYSFLVRGYMLCNNIGRSLHYLTAMIKQDFKPSNCTLRKLIACLCCNGELQSALNLSQEMESRGWIHSSSVQTSIVEALLSSSNLQQAVEFLDRMASKDLIPDNVQYDYLIKKFCQRGRLDKAVNLVNIMLQKGSLPASTSYDYLIHGFCNVHKLDTALDFYAEMLCQDMKPGKNTWDVLVCRLSGYGQVGEAEDVLKTGIRFGEEPSRESFCAVIDRYRAEKNVGKTSEVVKLMQEKGHVPDFDTHWSVVSNLSNCSKGDESSKCSSFLSGLLSGFGLARKNSNSKTS